MKRICFDDEPVISFHFRCGIIKFTSSPTTVAKWVLNRPYQSKFTEALRDMTDTSKSMMKAKKLLQPSAIQKSNQKVENIVTIISSQFISPFDKQLDTELLYNLVSGAPTSDAISDSLLSVGELGLKLKTEFEERMTISSEETFFSPIKKCKLNGFDTNEKKIVLKKVKKQKEISSQRDILGKLVSLSYKNKAGIDLEKVLTYPLSPVSAPLSLYDGSLRKTTKSSAVARSKLLGG